MANRDQHQSRERSAAIAASLHVLTDLLVESVARLTEAQASLNVGQQNEAIGSILELEPRLSDALALHRAILMLHRHS